MTAIKHSSLDNKCVYIKPKTNNRKNGESMKVSLPSRYNVTVYQRVPSMCEYHVTCRYVWNARPYETLWDKIPGFHSRLLLSGLTTLYILWNGILRCALSLTITFKVKKMENGWRITLINEFVSQFRNGCRGSGSILT